MLAMDAARLWIATAELNLLVVGAVKTICRAQFIT
jgi:hypothetical protein